MDPPGRFSSLLTTGWGFSGLASGLPAGETSSDRLVTTGVVGQVRDCKAKVPQEVTWERFGVHGLHPLMTLTLKTTGAARGKPSDKLTTPDEHSWNQLFTLRPHPPA